MLKIWVKLITDHKIVQDIVHEEADKYRSRQFDEYLRKICETLDIPTPMILSSHRSHFENFNQAKFRKHEFIESINFDEMLIENIGE